jgi:hypothetical protein
MPLDHHRLQVGDLAPDFALDYADRPGRFHLRDHLPIALFFNRGVF